MSFGSTFVDEAAAAMADEEPAAVSRFERLKQRILAGDPAAILEIANTDPAELEPDQRSWLENFIAASFPAFGDPLGPPYATPPVDPRIAAHAANQARAAASSVLPGIDMQVVLTGMDAIRTVAYRGLRALSRKIADLADRVCP